MTSHQFAQPPHTITSDPATMPNLFLVGAPKCGTTSMHAYLAQHPDIFMSTPKEPHYFSTDIHFRYRREHYASVDDYMRLFDHTARFARRGEASVWYLYSQTAAANIHRFNPGAAILCMIRNPVDMMFSMYRFSRKMGAETLPTFQAALDAEAERREGRRITRTVFVPVSLFYRDIATFSVQLERYFDHFGRDQVHVVLLDDLRQDPGQVCRTTFSFLGVSEDFTPDFTPLNTTDDIQRSVLYRFLRRMPRTYDRLRGLLPRRLRKAIQAYTDRLLPAEPEPETALSAPLRAALQQEFRPEVEQLSELLQRDLTAWCR